MEFPGEPARAHRSIPPLDESFPCVRPRARVRIRPYDIPRRCIWKIRSDGRKREKRVASVSETARRRRRAKRDAREMHSRARENARLGRYAHYARITLATRDRVCVS